MLARVAAWQGESGLVLALRRFLGRFEVRLFLSVCIVISLLPLPDVRRLDVVFLGVFGAEFLLRVLLVLRGEGEGEGWRWPTRGTLLLLLFDLLALVSFLPLVGHDTPWMRLLRVIRLVALLSYWAPVMHDLRSVLLRRERSRQVLVMGAMVGLLSFTGALVLEQIEAGSGVVDYDEDGQVTEHDARFFVHLWWAFRQIQDPGNMLVAPSSPGAVVVSIVLTVFGLLLISFLIGLGTDVVREVMTVSHLRSPGLAGHTVIVHVNASTGQLLEELVRYYQKLLPEGSLSRRWIRQLVDNARRTVFGPRYVVVGRSEERPAFLRRPALARIVYRSARAAHPEFMHRADVARAQRVVVLADLEAQNPDAETIHALLMIHDALRPANPRTGATRKAIARRASDGHHTHARERLLIAEILDERNLPAAWAAIDRGTGGAVREPGVGPATDGLRTFVIPIERLVGLLLACVARIDGVGPVLEELLGSHGHEIYTCFFPEDELATRPRLTGAYAEAMAGLRARAFARPPRRFLTPIGLLYEHTDAQGLRSRRMAIGAGGSTELGAPTWTGVVAVAPNFAVLRDLCDELQAPAKATAPTVEASELAGCPGSWRRRSCRCGGCWCAGFGRRRWGCWRRWCWRSRRRRSWCCSTTRRRWRWRSNGSASTAAWRSTARCRCRRGASSPRRTGASCISRGCRRICAAVGCTWRWGTAARCCSSWTCRRASGTRGTSTWRCCWRRGARTGTLARRSRCWRSRWRATAAAGARRCGWWRRWWRRSCARGCGDGRASAATRTCWCTRSRTCARRSCFSRC
jgi:hypothetical protein